MAGIPMVPLDRIRPNRATSERIWATSPRLAASIRTRGVQQPLVVVPQGQPPLPPA